MDTKTSYANGDNDNMDASLWKDLQYFIDLSMIYAKLPLAPFFRLRQVYKAWNSLASDLQFIEQNFKPPISSNPYFILPRLSRRHVLLTSEGSLWSSTPMPQTQFEGSDLLFDDSDCKSVFNLHTRVFHTLPPYFAMVQEGEDDFEYPLIGMTVDTTLIPYRFKVILAEYDYFTGNGTRVYDSNNGTWTRNSSIYWFDISNLSTSCLQHNESLYIMVGRWLNPSQYNVQIYDIKRNEWDFKDLGRPTRDVTIYMDIDVWQDRWFVFAMNISSHFLVWESFPNFEEPWVRFDSMPRDLCKWMMMGLSDYHNILTKFCGKHVLVYNHIGSEERAILYNLDQKTWDKIELPGLPCLQQRA